MAENETLAEAVAKATPALPLDTLGRNAFAEDARKPDRSTQEASVYQRGMEQGNPWVAMALTAAFRRDLEPTPGHQPFRDDIDIIDRHPGFAWAFVESQSTKESQRISAQLQLESKNRSVLDKAGWRGTLALMYAGGHDPINVIPFMGGFRAARFGMSALRAGKVGTPSVMATAGVMATEGAIAAGISETMLQESQISRTAAETYSNVIGSAVFSGIFGSVIRVFGKARTAAEGMLQSDIREALRVRSEAGELGKGAGGLPAQRENLLREQLGIGEDVDTAVFLSRMPQRDAQRAYAKAFDEGDPEVAKVLKEINSPIRRSIRLFGFAWNPAGRGATSLPRVRLATRKLVEDGFIRRGKGNEEVAEFGPSIESNIVRSQADGHILLEDHKRNFTTYRGTKDGQIPTQTDFNVNAGRAMRKSDSASWLDGPAKTHVEKSAKAARLYFDDKLTESMRTGLVTEPDLKGTAESYFPRYYSDELYANPKAFERWLMEERGFGSAEAKTATDNIVGRNLGPTGGGSDLPSAFRARQLRVPDAALDGAGWLVNDLEEVVRRFNFDTIPPLEKAKGLGREMRPLMAELLPRLQTLRKTSNPFELRLLTRQTSLLRISRRLRNAGNGRAAKEAERLVRQLEQVERSIEGARAAGGKAPDGANAEVAQIRKDLKAVIKAAQKDAGVKEKLPKDLKQDMSDREIRNALNDLADNISEMRRTHAMRAVNSTDELEGFAEEVDKLITVESLVIRDPSSNKRQKRKAQNEITRLQKQLGRDVRDHIQMSDRLLHKDVMRGDGHEFMLTAEASLLRWNSTTMLGGVALSSVPDVGMPIFVNGMRPWMGSVMQMGPMLKAMRGVEGGTDELFRMAGAAEVTGHARAELFSTGGPRNPRENRIDKFTGAITDFFFKTTGITWWNKNGKSWSAGVALNRIIHDMTELQAGRLTGRAANKAVRNMQVSGLPTRIYDDVLAMVSKHGAKGDGGFVLPVTQNWTKGLVGDELANAIDLKQNFQSAVITDVNRTILTPSAGGRPFFMTEPYLRVLTQYKTFPIEATNRILIAGIQRHDAEILSGIIALTTMGAITYAIKETLAGRELSEDPAVWAFEGIDRSGVFGAYQEVSNVLDRFGLGAGTLVGAGGASRYNARNTTDAILGPSMGRASDVIDLGHAITHPGTFDAFDTRRLKKMLPWSNHFGARLIFDAGEKAFNRTLGIPDRARKAQF